MNWSKKYQTEQWYKKQEEKNKQLEEEMVEKIKADKDFVQSLPPEKQTEYKLFKIFFCAFMVLFYVAAWIAYEKDIIKYLIPTLVVEGFVALISLVLWRTKPKKIKYPSVFSMPLIAFGLTILGVGAFILGDVFEGNLSNLKKDDTSVSQTILEDTATLEESSEYELWLRENKIIQGENQ